MVRLLRALPRALCYAVVFGNKKLVFFCRNWSRKILVAPSITVSCWRPIKGQEGHTKARMKRISFRRKSSKAEVPLEQLEDGGSSAELRCGAASVEGTSHANEDRVFETVDLRYVPNQPPVVFGEKIAFVAVFDGHGGGRCSEYLQNNLHKKVIQNGAFESFNNAQTVLLDAFKACEDEWNDVADQANEFSGSCAIAALVWGFDVVIAHAGDCRAVARMGKKTFPLTKDHRPSDPAEKARIYAAGGFIKNGRVMGALAPSRGFGDLDVKRKAASPDVIVSEPDIAAVRIEPSSKGQPSFVIFATDGIWDCMPSERACDVVAKSLAKYNDEERAAAKLCQVASELNTDDCSAVVVVFPSL
jgi:protein phosphatase PTC2/3